MTRRFPKAFRNGFNVTLHPERLDEPKHVKKPTMFFVCSMADLFHDDVPFEYIDRVMKTIEDCPQHTFQLLTKRTARMSEYFETLTMNIPKNCWLGTTVENFEVNSRIQWLKEIKTAPVRFLSCEPLLGYLDTLNSPLNLYGIDWVIVGGETGPKARPMKKEWVMNIKRQCDKQGVPFFFKSWGRYGEHGKPCPKDQHDLLEGVKYQAYPKGQDRTGTDVWHS